MAAEKTSEDNIAAYPIADAIPKEKLDAEAAQLEALADQPFFKRLPTYLRLGGPGFMGAALTLGAGTLTAAMLSGAQFGYKTLWISWVAIGSGIFMMAAMARFTTKGQFRIVDVQAQKHGWFIGKVLTAFLGLVCVSIIFNFGQVALGTHLIETIASNAGVSFPQEINWPLYAVITAWLSLSYGRGGKGVVLVETVMRLALLFMLLCFAAALVVVGIDWGAALEGFFIPWLPRGAQGIDLFIASSAAAIGVMDWIFFHYAGLAKGWRSQHESLARVDIVMGLAVPFIAVYFVVVSVFAATLYGSGDLPQTATELTKALIPLLGESGASFAFLLGFLAVPITSSVVMGIACAIGLHEAFNWEPDVRSWRWKLCVLAPQVGLFAAFLPSPIFLIIIITAFLSLSNNVVGWSLFMLFNDKSVLGGNRSKSYFWNLGIMLQISLLNGVAVLWIFNRFGLWG